MSVMEPQNRRVGRNLRTGVSALATPLAVSVATLGTTAMFNVQPPPPGMGGGEGDQGYE